MVKKLVFSIMCFLVMLSGCWIKQDSMIMKLNFESDAISYKQRFVEKYGFKNDDGLIIVDQVDIVDEEVDFEISIG